MVGAVTATTRPEPLPDRDAYTGVLDDLNVGMDPHTGKRYAFAGGNPITGVELDGHLTGAQCGPDGIRCGMTDMGSSAGYTPVVAPRPGPSRTATSCSGSATTWRNFGGGIKDGRSTPGRGWVSADATCSGGSSPFADERTHAETRARAQARKYAVTHPKQLAEAIIAPYQQDLAASRDGHAAGRAAFEAITVIGVGSLSKAGRATTAAEAASTRGTGVAASRLLSPSSLADEVASATGGVLKANKGGYTITIPDGSGGLALAAGLDGPRRLPGSSSSGSPSQQRSA